MRTGFVMMRLMTIAEALRQCVETLLLLKIKEVRQMSFQGDRIKQPTCSMLRGLSPTHKLRQLCSFHVSTAQLLQTRVSLTGE
jgi:hypothetical protein